MSAYSMIRNLCISLIVGLAVLLPTLDGWACPGCHSAQPSRITAEKGHVRCCRHSTIDSAKTDTNRRHAPCGNRQCINYCNLCTNSAEITNDIQEMVLTSSTLVGEPTLLALSAPTFFIFRPPKISLSFTAA